MDQSDIDLLDVRLLRLLEAIYITRSITRAAESLGLAQPTISIGLGRLRSHFGDPLFVRSPDGMLPTPLVDGMIGPVREALQALRQISEWRSEFDPAASTRKFRIAMTDASHITLLPELLAAVRSAAPSVQLEATRIDPQLPEALQSGDVDLVLGLVPDLETGFYQQTLYEQDWICIARKQNRLLASGLSLRTYQRASHVSIVYGTGQVLLERAIALHKIERRIALSLPGFLGLSTILAKSDLIATLPRNIGTSLAKIGELVVHECPFAIDRFLVKQHWHGRYHRDPANKWLRQLCAQLFMQSAGDA